jgi:NDP-sugar pyrophosphorylase family protein
MPSSPVQAVVMAGGRGTRLAPYTTVLPKPLMPVHDRPIIDIVIRQLEAAGVGKVTISVGHLGSLIESWVRNGAHYEVPVEFVYEDDPLGTAGSLRSMDDVGGTFIAMNGDVLTTLRLGDLIEDHERSDAIATVATNSRDIPIDYGVVTSEESGGAARRIVRLDEKPTYSVEVSMGIYVFEPGVLDYIEPGERIDFPDLLQRMMDAGELVVSRRCESYWRDIGNRDDHESAVVDFAAEPERFLGRG